jgi:predicted CXXCH cytochrome family protein
MGVEKQAKREQGALRYFTACGAMVVGASLLFLLYLVGCAKTIPQEDTAVPKSLAPTASQTEQETIAEATAVAETAVPATAEPKLDADKEKSPAPQPVKGAKDLAFHLKPLEEPVPQKPEKVPVTPRILEDKTMETKMPQLVAELAAKSKMFHPAHSPIKEGESCVSAKCHGEMLKGRYVHAPVATRACLICHTNIKKNPPFGLVSTGVDLCWRCHKNQKLVVGQSKYLHKIIKDQGCIGCHEPHSSNISQMLGSFTSLWRRAGAPVVTPLMPPITRTIYEKGPKMCHSVSVATRK